MDRGQNIADLARKRRPKSRPRPRRRSRVDMFFGFALIMVIIYIAGHAYVYMMRPQVTQSLIQHGSIADAPIFSGLIIRDERLIYAPSDGVLIMHQSEGARVSRGSAIATVQDAQAARDLRQSLAGMDQNALAIARGRPGLLANQAEIDAHNRHIAQFVGHAAFDLVLGQEDIHNLANRVSAEMEARNELFFASHEVSGELATARYEVFSGISAISDTIFAQNPGIISQRLDNVDSRVNLANMANIPREIVTEHPRATATPGGIALQGEPILRIIETNIWYIISYLPISITNNWRENSAVNIYVNDGGQIIPLQMTIYSIRTIGNESYVVMATDRELIRFLDWRSINFQLMENPHEGLLLPKTSIIEKTRLIIPSEFVSFDRNMQSITRRIGQNDEILHIFGNFSADRESFLTIPSFNGVNIGDILVNYAGETAIMTDIERVYGVFFTNRGFAAFRPIDKGGIFAENDSHIMLDPALNGALRPYDRIATDARNITDRQVIR
ncbi:MAG: hypothetical protein FWB71_02585 [Defluviitaleaceae bacterium]|nr:hypothetical protein [Defluviitaleaceae bacterium]